MASGLTTNCLLLQLKLVVVLVVGLVTVALEGALEVGRISPVSFYAPGISL